MPLNTKIRAEVLASLEGTADQGTPRVALSLSAVAELLSGTGTGQADRVFSDQRSINASSNESLDLSGALTDPLGGAVVFAEVVAILIKAAAANGGNLVVGDGSTPFIGPFNTDGAAEVLVPPGGFAMFYNPAGWPVTGASADLLKIANAHGGGAAIYDIIIIGRSA
jgi:hypothetical protein